MIPERLECDQLVGPAEGERRQWTIRAVRGRVVERRTPKVVKQKVPKCSGADVFILQDGPPVSDGNQSICHFFRHQVAAVKSRHWAELFVLLRIESLSPPRRHPSGIKCKQTNTTARTRLRHTVSGKFDLLPLQRIKQSIFFDTFPL